MNTEHEQECQHEDTERGLCGACNGSGEGMHDGTICGSCNGSSESQYVYCTDCGECVND
jgi:hypothetical protein